MTAPASDWTRIGGGFSVMFSLRGSSHIDCSWSPRAPTHRELRRHLDRYRKARSAYLAALAKHLGGTVACLELPL
jgi:hypothetical protein